MHDLRIPVQAVQDIQVPLAERPQDEPVCHDTPFILQRSAAGLHSCFFHFAPLSIHTLIVHTAAQAGK
jgi:hypothetical protein